MYNNNCIVCRQNGSNGSNNYHYWIRTISPETIIINIYTDARHGKNNDHFISSFMTIQVPANQPEFEHRPSLIRFHYA